MYLIKVELSQTKWSSTISFKSVRTANPIVYPVNSLRFKGPLHVCYQSPAQMSEWSLSMTLLILYHCVPIASVVYCVVSYWSVWSQLDYFHPVVI